MMIINLKSIIIRAVIFAVLYGGCWYLLFWLILK